MEEAKEARGLAGGTIDGCRTFLPQIGEKKELEASSRQAH